jgi:antibiotic biosynthesis monooxygenase (ABM) superfamily enzyme
VEGERDDLGHRGHGGVPQMVRTLVVAILQVVFMTCLVMPRGTKLLARWLFRP